MDTQNNPTIVIRAVCPFFEINEEVPQDRCVERLTNIREGFEQHARYRPEYKDAHLTVNTHVKDEAVAALRAIA